MSRLPRVGIVGHEAAKFTEAGEARARSLIRWLLRDPEAILVSGHCHLGGIDIWAEEEAQALGRELQIFPPTHQSWELGYKPRNQQIAETSDRVAVIVAREYPPRYHGMRFPLCYHCGVDTHIKSGGCWTGREARRLGKPAKWWVIGLDGTPEEVP